MRWLTEAQGVDLRALHERAYLLRASTALTVKES
jgi:hypothetical protein